MKAELLLKDDLFKAVMLALRTEAVDASCTTPGERPDDIALREGFRRDVKSLDRIKAKLEAIVASGRFAAEQLGDN